jgi:hypothetical protein
MTYFCDAVVCFSYGVVGPHDARALEIIAIV